MDSLPRMDPPVFFGVLTSGIFGGLGHAQIVATRFATGLKSKIVLARCLTRRALARSRRRVGLQFLPATGKFDLKVRGLVEENETAQIRDLL